MTNVLFKYSENKLLLKKKEGKKVEGGERNDIF